MNQKNEYVFDELVSFLSAWLKLRDDREAILTPILRQWEGYSDIEWEGTPRAFTTRLIKALPNYLLISTLQQIPVGTEQAEKMRHLCSQVTGFEQTALSYTKQFHELHRYPRGPLVEHHLLERNIKITYATVIDPSEAHGVISQANRFRVDADPCESVTLIKLRNLPPPLTVRPITFWEAAFGEACLHGPRMLAALLLVVPDAQFPSDVCAAKKALLEGLAIS